MQGGPLPSQHCEPAPQKPLQQPCSWPRLALHYIRVLANLQGESYGLVNLEVHEWAFAVQLDFHLGRV